MKNKELSAEQIKSLEKKLRTLQKALSDDIRRSENNLRAKVDPDMNDALPELENDDVLEIEEALEYAQLGDIEEALGRMKAGNYGICQECGKVIPFGRLSALPYALYCVECEGKKEKE
jgi:DnaK suppressor protein